MNELDPDNLTRPDSLIKVEKDGETHMLLDAASASKRNRDDFDDLLDFAPAVSNNNSGVLKRVNSNPVSGFGGSSWSSWLVNRPRRLICSIDV